MKGLSFYLVFLQVLLGMGTVGTQQTAWSATSQATTFGKQTEKPETQNADRENTQAPSSQSFEQVTKNTEKLDGLFTLYRNKATGNIYLEIKPEQLNKNYLATITMESGIGERGIYSGMPLQDYLFYFRRVNNNIHFVVRNVNFRTRPGDPQARSVNRSFSDSILQSLEIKGVHPQQQTILVDLGDLLLDDLPGISSILRGVLKAPYRIDKSKSYFGKAKVFPQNLEIDSVYGFSLASEGSSGPYIATLPDSRALTLKIHYSFSQLPQNNGYRPRLADDRVGYFTTVYQDFSNDNRQDQFVRYINRWHLEKQDPNAPLSPPKQPIVFWIENTVPLEYRDAIREGVLMWNKAFEKAGFKDAIAVQQMPDNASWDPADVRYNTIRWMNSLDGAFALGPSRVNPITGEILDADIVVDAGIVRSLKQDYRALVEPNQSGTGVSLSNLMNKGSLCADSYNHEAAPSLPHENERCFGLEFANQLAIGSLALSLLPEGTLNDDQMQQYIHQYVRSLIAHEVGHTLGLRHNFRASTLLKPEELNDTNITRTKGMVSSVMDYLPINLAPHGTQQGDYFTSVVGPYDRWAIEYGYKPSGAATLLAEKPFLQKIAQKQATNPELSYSPDEDSEDLDPTANRFDMSNDPLRYSQGQLENARLMWERLNQRYPKGGGSYSEVSQLFDTVFFYYLQNVYFITKYIGGQSFYRDHAGSSNGRLPFEPVPAEKQREALTALQKYVFAEDAFNFPPELLNKLAPSRWLDWGSDIAISRLDYPVHDSIFFPQSLVLRGLLSGDRLSRLRDLELKTQPGQAFTMPELFNGLQTGIWTEVLPGKDRSVKISSLRRALQREHLRLLTNMVLRTSNVPEDARTLAWANLRQLRQHIDSTLRKQNKKLDDYTRAHLEETRDRITKVLDAPLSSKFNGKKAKNINK